MKKLDQKGLTGPVEIGLIAVFVLFVGFVAYRIGNARNDSSANNANTAADQDASEIELKETEADEAKEVDVPAEEEKQEAVEAEKEEVTPEPVKTTTPEVKKEQPVEEPVKKEKIYVDFTSATAEQVESVVNVRATLESNQSGECWMKLYREDQPKVKDSVTLSNAKVCETTFNVADIPVAGEWELHVWFAGKDGITEGYYSKTSVNIVK